IRSADDARRFLQLLRQTIVELGISDAEMEKGTLRCDANVSVRRAGETGFRTRWELKNMNSFTFIGRGIEAAACEQIALHEAGRDVVQQTYDYDADKDALTPHRAKEEAEDYRYFPEPDLVPIEPDRELVERLRAEVGEAPASRIRRCEPELGFELAYGLVTTGRDRLYEAVPGERRSVANVLMNQLAAAGVDPASVDAAELGKLIEARDRIPRTAFVEALAASGNPGFAADSYLADASISDESELEPIVDRVLAENPDQVGAYRAGKQGLLGFFVGQVMRETNGKANAKV